MRRRSLLFAALFVVPALALAIGLVRTLRPDALPPPLGAPAAPLLPDLALSPLGEIRAGVAANGNRYLLFTAAIANVGSGPLLINAVRTSARDPWRVSQRFAEPDGSTTEVASAAELVWGGHGHDHWHVRLGASYRLTRPGSTLPLRRYAKVGFCFFDQTRLRRGVAGTPAAAQFARNGCSEEPATSLTMGLSPGWADPYPWTLPDQRLRVNGLADGVYRLWATADPDNAFRESDEENNLTWVDLRLTFDAATPHVAVVRRGQSGASGYATVG